ncbi:MAG: AAA family ATPase [archaeon]
MDEQLDKLISKRDNLLDKILNKEIKLVENNLKKKYKEKKEIGLDKKNVKEETKIVLSKEKNNNLKPKKKILKKAKKEEMRKEHKRVLEKEKLMKLKIAKDQLKKQKKYEKKEKEVQKFLDKKIKLENEVKSIKKNRVFADKDYLSEKQMKDNKKKRKIKIKKEKIAELEKKQIKREEMKKRNLEAQKKMRTSLKINRKKKVKIENKRIISKNRTFINPVESKEIKETAELISKLKREVAKVVVGQEEVIDAFICAIICDGHVLLEGVPGVAKTLIVKTLAEASGCSSKRVQFTVDLLPSDILGITTYTPQKGFETIKGPIFSNFIIADEINRSPPKTQSAMIEAMQEKQVTIGKETFKLPLPFFVMANNNPLEVSGVYTLPEAQIDRFLFKLLINYPNNEEEKVILEDNISIKKFEDFDIKPILSSNKIIKMQKLVKKIYVDEKIKDYIVRIVEKTRKKDFPHGQYIEWGGSPRANIGLFIASKAWALMHGRNYVIPKDVKDIAHHVLRHRIILNYRARAEGLDSDKIIDELLKIIEV